MLHARGTFEVKTQPISPGPAAGLGRFSLEKQIHGDLEGASQGEMLTAGDVQKGEAGYVAIERVTGTLQGKSGSFALQHVGTMNKDGFNLLVSVVPGSGSGELQGMAGTFSIIIEGGQHRYELEYSLP